MQGFTEKIVGMMKSEELFASQGGPIILSQASINVFFELNVEVLHGTIVYCIVFSALYSTLK
jgi:hypothetical protein